MKQPKLRTVPLSLAQANEYVNRVHRHHESALNHKFSFGCVDEDGNLRGVAMLGRPVSRWSDDGWTLEVIRLATDGCPNACSYLYGVARRLAKEYGYAKLQTYTLLTEGGASLRAAGWRRAAITQGNPRTDKIREIRERYSLSKKVRWEVLVGSPIDIDIDQQIEKLDHVEKRKPAFFDMGKHLFAGKIQIRKPVPLASSDTDDRARSG